MTLNQAVRDLRKSTGKSQQLFATELGICLRAFQRYEHTQLPEPKPLFALECAAVEAGRSDLAEVFHGALSRAMGPGFPRARRPKAR
jgi:hypothetical protein